jgi:hypothetical protein
MIGDEFKLKLGNWSYVLKQDPTSGELSTVRLERIGLVQKAVEYAKAEVSALVKDVPLPQLQARMEACATCESREVDGGAWYCNSCGCPKWNRSRLQAKWEMPAATCPRGKWPQ